MNIQVPITPEMRVQLQHAQTLTIDLPVESTQAELLQSLMTDPAGGLDYNAFKYATGYASQSENQNKTAFVEWQNKKLKALVNRLIHAVDGLVNSASTERLSPVQTALKAVQDNYAAGQSPIKKYAPVIEKMEEVAAENPHAFMTFGGQRTAQNVDFNSLLIGEIGEALTALDMPNINPPTVEDVFNDIKRRIAVLTANVGV